MKGAQVHSLSPSELRERAERRIRRKEPRIDVSSCSEHELRRLVHELQVHQVELELQNEELRRVREELEAQRDAYEDLYELAPVGYLTLGASGVVQKVNLRAAELLGLAKSRIVGWPLDQLLEPESRWAFRLHMTSVFRKHNRHLCEVRFAPRGGQTRVARLESIAVPGPDGARLCRTALSEVTETARP